MQRADGLVLSQYGFASDVAAAAAVVVVVVEVVVAAAAAAAVHDAYVPTVLARVDVFPWPRVARDASVLPGVVVVPYFPFLAAPALSSHAFAILGSGRPVEIGVALPVLALAKNDLG